MIFYYLIIKTMVAQFSSVLLSRSYIFWVRCLLGGIKHTKKIDKQILILLTKLSLFLRTNCRPQPLLRKLYDHFHTIIIYQPLLLDTEPKYQDMVSSTRESNDAPCLTGAGKINQFKYNHVQYLFYNRISLFLIVYGLL